MNMLLKVFRGMNPWSQLIMAIFLMIVFFFIISVLSIPIAMSIFGSTEVMNAWAGKLQGTEEIKMLKYIQTTQSIGLFVVPPIITGWLFEGNPFTYLHLNTKVNKKSLGLAIIIVIVISPLISVLGEWNSQLQLPESMHFIQQWMTTMEDRANGLIQQFLDVHSAGGILFNYLMIAILPAIGEEFLFRGVLQNIFLKMAKNYHVAIWITAILFSAIHMQFFGFIPRMILGAVFGYMVYYSRSLWLSILCHFINNTVAVSSMIAAQNGHEKLSDTLNFSNIPLHIQIILAVVSTVITYWLIKKIRKNDYQEASC